MLPYLSHGLIAWSLAADSLLDKILSASKESSSFNDFCPIPNTCYTSFHFFELNANISAIHLNFKLTSSLMFDVSKNSVPHSISTTLTSHVYK